MQLAGDRELLATADCGRGRAPFADPVHREHCRLLIGRGIEGARRMAHVVLGEEKLVLPVEVRRKFLQLAADDVLLKQLLAQPERDGQCERLIAARRKPNIGLQEPLELEKRLLVEHYVIDLIELAAFLLEAIRDRMSRKARILLLAGEALLLCCGHNAAVDQERRSTVVIERGNTKDSHDSQLRTKV